MYIQIDHRLLAMNLAIYVLQTTRAYLTRLHKLIIFWSLKACLRIYLAFKVDGFTPCSKTYACRPTITSISKKTHASGPTYERFYSLIVQTVPKCRAFLVLGDDASLFAKIRWVDYILHTRSTTLYLFRFQTRRLSHLLKNLHLQIHRYPHTDNI